MSLSEAIKQQAVKLGFDLVGITDASPIDAEQVRRLADWLEAGLAGRMEYMHRNFEKRIEPAGLMEGAESVICLGLNYTLPKQKLASSTSNIPTGRVANFARYQNYHSFLKKQLQKLCDFISSQAGREFKFKTCVDSAPLAERALAVRAGLGFIGKNHMLINPRLGCQIFLSEIITTLKLPPDEPTTTKCLNCDRCILACPTGALRADGRFDANKCNSYLTIEYKGRIPPELAEKIGNLLFGCDECALACPWQKDAPLCRNKHFKFYDDIAELDLQEILNLDDEGFESRFADSSIKRLGLELLKRNARICLANLEKQARTKVRAKDESP